jgi:hypothetical protein
MLLVASADVMDDLIQQFEAPMSMPPVSTPNPATARHGIGEGLAISLRPQLEARAGEVVCGNVAHRHHLTHHINILCTGVVGEEGDGSWCFSINFRTLTAIMVKDKFLIPMVEELLGKLCG